MDSPKPSLLLNRLLFSFTVVTSDRLVLESHQLRIILFFPSILSDDMCFKSMLIKQSINASFCKQTENFVIVEIWRPYLFRDEFIMSILQYFMNGVLHKVFIELGY